MSLIEVKDLKYRYPGTTQLALDGVLHVEACLANQ